MKTLFSLLAVFAVPLLSAQSVPCPQRSHISIESGSFSSRPGVTFRLRHFTANLVPLGKTAPNCFQKMTFVSHAAIFVDNESLTRVFSEKLERSDSKIKGLRIENRIGKVALSGSITKVIPIAFTIEGTVTTDGTSILLNTDKIKADGIPLKALLAMLGQHLNSVLGFKDVSGVTVDEDRLSFSPEQVAHLKGHIQSIETSPQGLTLHYSETPKQAQRSGT